MFVISKNNKEKQLFFLVISVAFMVGVFIAFVITDNVNYFYIAVISLVPVSVINWIVSRVFDIAVKENKLYIENLYKKRVVECSLFESVINIKYYIPLIYPFFSPPYYQVKLKDGKRYIFYDTSFKALSSIFNKRKKHAEFLTETIAKHFVVN